MWKLGSDFEDHCAENLKWFLEETFKRRPWADGIGQKGLKVIKFGEEEPTGVVFIRIHKLGSDRDSYCMGQFNEHQLIVVLDIRVEETEQKPAPPDRKTPQISITNQSRKVIALGTNGEIASKVCSSIKQIFNLDKYRRELSELGVHNIELKDERVNFQGAEYQNPMRLVFETYVLNEES